MTSNINPNNIDGTYPVAGQDNNSQGFRDNFTNTKTNFQYAADEITELQTNAVLKSALTGTTLDNDMLGSLLYNVTLNDLGYTRLPLTQSGSTITLNYALGTYQTVTLNAAANLGFSNWPATGIAGEIYFQVTVNSTAYTLTLPAAVTIGTTGIQGISGQTITFGATGTYNFRFTSNDGGTTVTVYDLNRPLNVFTNGLQSISDTSKIGYGSGAGDTVTQGTSRTTNVTINAPTGAITLFSAAGTSSYTTFTVVNSVVTATDVVIVNQKSGTDKYETFVTNVGAGSFDITFADVSGTTTEAPVFNFVVIKGSTS